MHCGLQAFEPQQLAGQQAKLLPFPSLGLGPASPLPLFRPPTALEGPHGPLGMAFPGPGVVVPVGTGHGVQPATNVSPGLGLSVLGAGLRSLPATTAEHHPGPLVAQAGHGPSCGLGAFTAPVVPVEYANSKLWGVTSEYENLLNIQRDQHLLAVRQREAEAAHLRKALQMLEEATFREDAVVARIRAKEEEVGLAVQAKQKELELFAALLQLRDRQIGDLQEMCEGKQAEIRRLQRLPMAAGELALCSGGSQALADAMREVEELRRQRTGLERLLLARDRQLSAVQGVDPEMLDSSALQLGAQAIQMVHDSMRLRAEASVCGEENQELREEVGRLQARIVDLEADVAEKRGEIKEMSGALAGKMQKTLELETELEAAWRDKKQSAKEASAKMEDLQEQLTAWQHDCRSARQLAEQLEGELADRERRYLRQQAECTQHKVNVQQLERKVEELGAQLAQAEEALAQLLRSNSYKNQLVRSMTEQVNFSESKLQSYQINELMGSRHRISGRPGCAATPTLSAFAANGESPGEPHRPMVAGLPTQETPSWRSPAARAAAVPSQQHSPFGTSSSSRCPSPSETRSYHSHLRKEELFLHRVAAPAALALAPPPELLQCYRPHPGDAVDLALADFLNRPEGAASRALFCRLSEGNYLYGTQRVSLRLHPRSERLEAIMDGEWGPLEALEARMHKSLSFHGAVAFGALSQAMSAAY